MDPNLYFRFAIPGWTAFFAAFIMALASGLDEVIARLPSSLCDAQAVLSAAVALAVAFLGAPAFGFLLNTLIVAVCMWRGWGPYYSETYRRFRDRVRQALGEPDPVEELPGSEDKDMSIAIVAHFEYRTDTPELLEWRRRARAAFFANLANAVAVVFGVAVTAPAWTWSRWFLIAPFAALNMLFVLCFVFVGLRSPRVAEYQLGTWVDSLTHDQIRDFMRHKGCGTNDKKPASD